MTTEPSADTMERARALTEAERRDAIGVGMAIAAGIIVSNWGDEVQAEEILGAAGLTTAAELRKAGVDQYDIDLLKPVLATLRAHKRWQKTAAIRNQESPT